jgi:hypothetical protein
VILQGDSGLVAFNAATPSFDNSLIRCWSLLLPQGANGRLKSFHGDSVVIHQALAFRTNHGSIIDPARHASALQIFRGQAERIMRHHAADRCSLMAQLAWRQLQQESSMVSFASSQYRLQYLMSFATRQLHAGC